MDEKLINEFREKIQVFIKAQNEYPTPIMVFDHLLSLYISGLGFPGSGFIATFTRTHINFAIELRLSIKTNKCDLIKQLDDHLKNNKLVIKGDFFSLLIAYFYYYKDCSRNLSEYHNLKNQIIIPLHIYKEKLHTAQVDSCLTSLHSQDANVRLRSTINLGSISITKNKNEEVVDVLLAQVKEGKKECESVKGGGLYILDFPEQACIALGNNHIPQKRLDDVIDILLLKLDHYHSLNDRFQQAICEALGKISIPKPKIELVITKLLEFAVAPSWHLREVAWKALKRVNVSEKIQLDFIAMRLKIIKGWLTIPDPSRSVRWFRPNVLSEEDKANENFEKACLELSTMGAAIEIPESIRKEVIVAMLAMNIENKIPEYFYQVLKYLTPASLITTVLDRLIADLKNNREKIRRSDAIQAMQYIGVPQDRLAEVIHLLIEYIKEAPNDSFYEFQLLSKIKIPAEIKDEVRNVLVLAIDKVEVHLVDNIAAALVHVGFSPDQFDLLHGLLTSKARASQDLSVEAGIYAEFARVQIPDARRDKFIKELLARIDELSIQKALKKMELSPNECKKIIEFLIDRIVKSKDGYHSIAMLNIIIKLQRFMLPYQSVAIRAMLEGILPLLTDENKRYIAPCLKKFEDLCRIKMLLSKKLPADLVLRVLKS